MSEQHDAIGQHGATAARDAAGQLNEAQLENVAFVGSTLSPFYLTDPGKGDLSGLYDAFLTLDVDQAAHDWPFVEDGEAAADLALMVTGLRETSADDTMWEYRRLFVGPNKMPAPPWGSVYTDRDCVVFGESTLALRAWMRANGIQRLGEERVPEDHIGLMLALMAWIAENQPAALAEFLTVHFLPWSSHLLDELEEATTLPLFKGLFRLTRASLEGMQWEFDLHVEYPRFYR